MSVQTPEQINERFRDGFNARSLDALLSLYESDAVLVPRAGEPPIQGRDRIAQSLQGLLALGGTISFTRRHTLNAGDVALLGIDWTITGASVNGERIDLSGHTAEVVRRQPDGTWKYVIDHPFDFAHT